MLQGRAPDDRLVVSLAKVAVFQDWHQREAAEVKRLRGLEWQMRCWLKDPDPPRADPEDDD